MSSFEKLENIPANSGLLKCDDPLIRFLIDRKFPWLKRISSAPPPGVPVGTRTGPRTIIKDGKPTPTAVAEVKSYEAELLALSPADRRALFNQEAAKAAEERSNAQEIERQLQEKKLFGQWPAADFRHWLQVALWSADEAVSLSLSKEPNTRFTWAFISTVIQISDFARTYEKRRRLVFRAVEAGDLLSPMRPHQFMVWAAAQNVDVPNELRLSAATVPSVQAADAGPSQAEARDAVAPSAPGPAPIRPKLDSRSNDMTAVIEKAINKAADPNDVSSVWAALVALAGSPDHPPPLLDASEGEVKYWTGNECKFLSKKNLADRLRRRRRKSR
jgi:hypothetical protein